MGAVGDIPLTPTPCTGDGTPPGPIGLIIGCGLGCKGLLASDLFTSATRILGVGPDNGRAWRVGRGEEMSTKSRVASGTTHTA